MFRSGKNIDIYDHKFTLLPKYGNWASPEYLRSTVIYTKKKPVFNIKPRKIGGGLYRKKTFHRTKKNISKRTTRSRKLL